MTVVCVLFVFWSWRVPQKSTQSISSAASDVYKRHISNRCSCSRVSINFILILRCCYCRFLICILKRVKERFNSCAFNKISCIDFLCTYFCTFFYYIREWWNVKPIKLVVIPCLLYTSDAADDLLCVALGGRRIIKKTNKEVLTRRQIMTKSKTTI